jgi:hypothetical protein
MKFYTKDHISRTETGDQFYDFLIIFAKQIGILDSKHCFLRKTTKIGKNCDHNLDPWLGEKLTSLFSNEVACFTTR